MSVQENSNNNFNWLYYALGLFFGILTGAIITQNLHLCFIRWCFRFVNSRLIFKRYCKRKKILNLHISNSYDYPMRTIGFS